MQDARKGVLFDDFPPVLQLQLKRFEYDFRRDIMVKVYTFIPLQHRSPGLSMQQKPQYCVCN